MRPHQSTLRMIKSLVCTRSGLAPERCAWEVKRGSESCISTNTGDQTQAIGIESARHTLRKTISARPDLTENLLLGNQSRALAADEGEPVACQGEIMSAGQLLLRDLRKSNAEQMQGKSEIRHDSPKL
jgi:hypothetical protein